MLYVGHPREKDVLIACVVKALVRSIGNDWRMDMMGWMEGCTGIRRRRGEPVGTSGEAKRSEV